MHLAAHQPEFRSDSDVAAEWLLLWGISLTVPPLLLKMRDSTGWEKLVESVSPGWLLLGGTILVAVLAVHNGFRQFGGYDDSGLIQITSNLRAGLIPYADFPCTYPPAFFLGAFYASELFGPTWASFVYANGAFAVISFILIFVLLLRIHIAPWQALAVALLPQSMSTLLVGFWWWNPLASLAVILTLSSCLAALRRENSTLVWLSVFSSTFLLILSKPNAWPVGLCYVMLLCHPSKRWGAAVVCSAAVVCAEAICRLHGFSLANTFSMYRSIAATRGNPLTLGPFVEFGANVSEGLNFVLFTLLLVVLSARALFAQKRVRASLSDTIALPAEWPSFACCLSAIVAGLSLAFTNFENKLCDLSPIAFTLAILCFKPFAALPNRREAVGLLNTRPIASLAALCFCMSASLYWSATRLRVRTVGEDVFYEPNASIRIQSGFFRGLLTGPRFMTATEEIKEVVDRDRRGRIFFGPRLEFSYASLHLWVPKGLPIFWHEGSAFPSSMLPRIEQKFWDHHFTTLVFLKGDYIFMPHELLNQIKISYRKVDRWPMLDVYVLSPVKPESVDRP